MIVEKSVFKFPNINGKPISSVLQAQHEFEQVYPVTKQGCRVHCSPSCGCTLKGQLYQKNKTTTREGSTLWRRAKKKGANSTKFETKKQAGLRSASEGLLNKERNQMQEPNVFGVVLPCKRLLGALTGFPAGVYARNSPFPTGRPTHLGVDKRVRTNLLCSKLVLLMKLADARLYENPRTPCRPCYRTSCGLPWKRCPKSPTAARLYCQPTANSAGNSLM